MTPSSRRIAAGAGLLATFLVANSGAAVAFADTGSGGAAETTGSTASPAPSVPGQGSLIGATRDALQSTLSQVAATVGAVPQRSSQPPSGPAGSATTPDSTDPFAATAHITRTVTGVLTPPPKPIAPSADPAALPSPAAATTVPAAAKPDTTTPVAPVQAVASTPRSVAPNLDVAAPAAALVTVAQSLVTMRVTDGVAALQSLAAPIPDVLASLQAVLVSAGDAIAPLVQLPSDFASLFAGTVAPPVSRSVGTSAPPAGSGSTASSPLSTLSALTATADATTAVTTNAVPTSLTAEPILLSTTAALAEASSSTMSARVAPDTAIPEGLQEFFHAYGTVIVAASLSALAAAALPGILGFLIPTAAGVRIGYRQAKAGTTLHASGIARFAGGGPVGIVRAGSLVSLHSRPSRAVRSHGHAAPRQVA